MLAIASGAWLLSPAWLTASLEAGAWVPEAGFEAGVRFAAAAARARAATAGPNAAPLLAGEMVYVHLEDKCKKLLGSNAAALRRIAAALGARAAATPPNCSLCVVVGGGRRPAGLPAEAACVREEWLLAAAETYERPLLEAHALA